MEIAVTGREGIEGLNQEYTKKIYVHEHQFVIEVNLDESLLTFTEDVLSSFKESHDISISLSIPSQRDGSTTNIRRRPEINRGTSSGMANRKDLYSVVPV